MPESVAPERLNRKTTSLVQLFADRVRESPDREAYRFPLLSAAGETTEWRSLTWKQTSERVNAIAAGLLALGLAREERVGVLSNTRIDWILCDLGILAAGGATTTVYPSSTAEECAYILADSETRYVFAEDEGQAKKLVDKKSEMPGVQKVIVIEGTASGDWQMTIADLEKLGTEHLAKNAKALDDVRASIKGTELATLIYTSGTTGKPKGVRLLHESWAYEADAMDSVKLWHADDVQYLWLPLSHSFGKVLLAGHIVSGSVTAVDGRIPKIVENLAIVRPTIMAAVPRIFEKVYNKICEGARVGGLKQTIFDWSINVGRAVSKLKQEGKQPGGMLALKAKLANKLVWSKVKARFGGRVKFFISGSAPLSREIAEFFHACDILILEGYGLTESSAASCVNRPTKYAFGTIGMPMPGTELKIAPEDGEILMKGPGIMQGYHNMDDATAETLTADGWLRTGDIGEIDAQGFVRITDRKKDLIKTSGGKYIAPQHLEGKLKMVCPFISQVVVHGDKRNFVSALFTLDEETTMKWAKEKEVTGSFAEVLTSPELKKIIEGAVAEVNKSLMKFETIKKFEILPKDLTVEAGELTPSLKVKRKFVEKKYAAVLDKMYEGSVAGD